VRLAAQYDLVVTDACFHRPALELARRMAPPEFLTSRESQILGLARNGYRSEEIAAILHLTLHTVEFHFRNANAKLGARSRTQGVARAIFLGVISSSELPKGDINEPIPSPPARRRFRSEGEFEPSISDDADLV
jgi:DNA-binding CsgD family transcriptional regulator